MLQPHQQRVVTELDELNAKRVKLSGFLDGQPSHSLHIDELERLIRQLGIMDMYAKVLAERIAHFEVT